ncbi:AT-rich interactive domain-containing protein 4A [Protopterus annectens]|uniref:AT-rich interactive domain-containing protein 4A n=1 Tax=Protopterus annectens TaxID=7888 RepID=UPI001CFA5611|nr:AT-rich interactive domain-containing protein 4A [Protopterus annectens]
MKAADEPAYLTVGTDVSAKYRGAFCEAKIKSVKRLVKVKVFLKEDSSNQLVQDDQVKGPLRVGATVEVKCPDGSFQDAIISKLTDASWYTVVFDDGDERTLRRTSLCLKGERHFAESETLDQLPLTNPEHFGTPVIGKKSNRGRRSSLPLPDDEKYEESSEEDDDDLKRTIDDLPGKVVCVEVILDDSSSDWYPALVLSPSCNDDLAVKKEQCLVRSFSDSKFYLVARKDVRELEESTLPNSKQGLQEALRFWKKKTIPERWKMDLNSILDSSSSEGEEEDQEGELSADEDEEDKEEEVPEEEQDPEERDNFLQQLYKFMEDRGTSINKPPVLGYKDLDLFKLFRLVHQHGGFDNIESGSVWKQIYTSLGIPILNSAASYNIKTAYKKYLYGFEEYCLSAGIQFRTVHHNNPKEEQLTDSETLEDEEEEEEEEEKETAVRQEQTSLPEEEEEDEEETEESDALKATIVEDEEEKETDSIEEEGEEEDAVDTKDYAVDEPLSKTLTFEANSKDSETESEKEIEVRPKRGRRRKFRDQVSAKKEGKGPQMEDKVMEESNRENEIVEEKERETSTPVRKMIPKQRAEKVINKKIEESDKDSDEEEDDEEREESENRESDEEKREGNLDLFLAGTKVKVKYGRGKTQKIYEANIKSSENDNGETLYLVHYYGWNVRYDEWVKPDRIIWPSEKGGRKRKYNRKLKVNCKISFFFFSLFFKGHAIQCFPRNKYGTPRRRTRQTYGLYDSDQGSNDSSSSSDSEVDEPSEKVKEETHLEVKQEELNEKIISENQVDQQSLACCEEPKEKCHTASLEIPVKQDCEEPGDTAQNDEKMTEVVEEAKKEAEKSPKCRGRKCKTRDSGMLCLRAPMFDFIEELSKFQSEIDGVGNLSSSVDPIAIMDEEEKCLDVSSFSEDSVKEDKRPVKRKSSDPASPDKKIKLEDELELAKEISEEETEECLIKAEGIENCHENLPENDIKEIPSLSIEEHRLGTIEDNKNSVQFEDTEEDASKFDEDYMPHIGPEALVCHEVDLDDLDEKEKSSSEDTVMEKYEPPTPTVHTPLLSSMVPPNFSLVSPPVLCQDESRSIKSESDITIEVDSVAEESQEGLCESESVNGFEASTTSSTCSLLIQEQDSREINQKRSGDISISSLTKKQKRNQKRSSAASINETNGGHSSDSEDLSITESSSKCTSLKHGGLIKPQKLARLSSLNSKDGEKDKHREKHQNITARSYKWSFQITELENMTSTERIIFLQEKLQEIRKYYMSLKSEVATIDRRRKRLKKKEREVSHTGALSSGSSDTGMSPSSSSPPQNTVAVECR